MRVDMKAFFVGLQAGRGWHYYHHDYHSAEDVLRPDYFLSLRQELKPRDRVDITLGDIDQGNAGYFIETVVTRSAREGVVLSVLHEHSLPGIPVESKVPEPPAPRYVTADGKVEWNIGRGPPDDRGRFVVTVDGEEVAAVKDKELAEAIARGDEPIPEPEAA